MPRPSHSRWSCPPLPSEEAVVRDTGDPCMFTPSDRRTRFVVSDTTPSTPTTEIPDFLAAGEAITRFRLRSLHRSFFPCDSRRGNRIRVVDRPARAVKPRIRSGRHGPRPAAAISRCGPRDGHLFLAHPTEPALIELNRFGNFIRSTHPSISRPAGGGEWRSIAARDSIARARGGRRRHRDRARSRRPPRGDHHSQPSRNARRAGLRLRATRNFTRPLRDEGTIGVFGDDGRLRRTLPFTSAFSRRRATIVFADVLSLSRDARRPSHISPCP